MNVANQVLETISAAGISLRPDGDRILATPASRLTDELRGLIREHKAALVAELRREQNRRAVVEVRFEDAEWFVALGKPGDAYEQAAESVRRRLGAVETRPRETLPAGFPFQRQCSDCDGSGCDTCGGRA